MKYRIGMTIALAAFALTLLFAACSTPAPEAPVAPAPVEDHDEHAEEPADHTEEVREIDISLTEFSITPFEVEQGETVKFNVTNDGVVPHEFRGVMPDMDHDHDADHEGDSALALLLEPGESGEITLTFDMITEIACLLVGHYEAGMFVDLS